jgi:hypothetical protein
MSTPQLLGGSVPSIVTDYKLAAGHNNTAGYTAIDEITDGTDTLDEPKAVNTSIRGVRRFTLEQPKFSGTKTMALVFTRMTIGLLEYMQSNYEGLVTVRIPFTGVTFADYNATLVIPDKGELQEGYYLDAVLDTPGFQEVVCPLFDIEAV